MEQKFIIIDTSTWISLAQQESSPDYIEKIEEILKYPAFKIIVPDSTLIEFNRNKKRIIKEWQKSNTSRINSYIKYIKTLLPEKTEILETIKIEAEEAIQNEYERIETNFNSIESILKKANKFSTNIYLTEAAKRCLNHQAPAEKSTRSSIGDCLIWLAILEHLDQGEVWFCTENKNDFSQKTNESELCESLQEESNIKPFPIVYFNKLNKLIEEALPDEPKLPEFPLPASPFLSVPKNYSCHVCHSNNIVSLPRFVPGSGAWYDYLKCLDCGEQRLINIEYTD